jgi:predicted DNA-binding transcriptional regulator AlpA
MQRSQPADRLLKDTEVAEILSVTRDTVWKQSRAGIIPCPVRHGIGAARWRLSEINAYIASLEHINTKGGKP